MQRQNAFRSHAFGKPRYLDGQGDETTEKRLAWKGTVASRIRSLNDMNNAARTTQTSTRSVQEALERAKPSNRPTHASSRAPTRSDESHGSGSLSGRANPFVRRSPPSLPEQVAHSSVPVRSPVPSVLVRRPSFFEDHNEAARQPAAHESRSLDPDTGSRQGFGRHLVGKNAGSGSARIYSLTHAHTTARLCEDLKSRQKAVPSGLERDTRGGLVMVGQKQRAQLEDTSPWAVETKKLQPDLRSKNKLTPNMPETERDAIHGLTVEKASLPNSVRPTSPSIGIGPRNATFGRAGRVRSVSPDEFDQAKIDNVRRHPVRLEGIEPIIQDIQITSTSIETTAREIRAVAQAINLVSSLPANTDNEESAVSSVSGLEPQPQENLQGKLLPAHASSGTARMRRNAKELTVSQDDYGASPASDVIDSIYSILAGHDGVVDHVIEQLQACGQRLQVIRNLSQRFASVPRASLSAVGQRDASDSTVLPTNAQVPVITRAPVASTSGPSILQGRRTRSAPDFVHPVYDSGEKLGLNKEIQQRTLSRAFANSLAELPAESVQSAPTGNMRPHLSTRYFDEDPFPCSSKDSIARTSTPTPPPSPPTFREDRPVRLPWARLNTVIPISLTLQNVHAERHGSPLQGRKSNPTSPRPGLAKRPSTDRRHYPLQHSSSLSAKGGTDSPVSPTGSTLVSVLESLRPTPAVYFPYQHLPFLPDSDHAASFAHQDCHPMLQTKREDSREPITRAPETPPPPPPLFSMNPEVEFGISPDGLSPLLSPLVIDYRPSPTDQARAATRASLEREHNQFFNPKALIVPITMVGQRAALVDVPSEDTSVSPEFRSMNANAGSGGSPLMPNERPTHSSRSSESRALPSTQQILSENSSAKLQRPRLPPRQIANIQRGQSPAPSLSTSTFPSPSASPFLSRPRFSLLQPSATITTPPDTHILTDPESPIFIQLSASHSPTTMAAIAAAIHRQPTDQQLPLTPAPLLSPLPSSMVPPPLPVRRSSPPPKSVEAAKGSSNDDDPTSVTTAMMATMMAAIAQQQQSPQQSQTSLSSPALSSTSSIITTLPTSSITVQPLASHDSSAPAFRTTSLSPSVDSTSSSSSSSSAQYSSPQPQSFRQADDTGPGSFSSNDDEPVLPPTPSPAAAAATEATVSAKSEDGSSADTTAGRQGENNMGQSRSQRRPHPHNTPSYFNHQRHQRHSHARYHYHYHFYQPLKVPDRVRMLEEARRERMRILRATGAVMPSQQSPLPLSGDGRAVSMQRRFTIAGLGGGSAAASSSSGMPGEGCEMGEESDGDGGARSLLLLLGGPREQIGALGAPWW